MNPEAMPPNIRSTQPGGGYVLWLELAWGRIRRWILKTFRPGHVQRMRSCLHGDPASCPVEVIDSRDLKWFRNVAHCHFDPADDPFVWRDRMGLARAGFAEMFLFGGLCVGLAAVFAWPIGWPWLSPVFLGLAVFVVAFFRDPNRPIPSEPNVFVSPADGRVADIEPIEHPFLQEPAVRIGIFLSVFDVHVNRIPAAAQVIGLDYRPGRFLDARDPGATDQNERLEARLVESSDPPRRFVVRQIAGLIARRIVCELRPGQLVTRGERFGMIKFGSRTELILPAAGLRILVQVGDKVRGGASRLAQYET